MNFKDKWGDLMETIFLILLVVSSISIIVSTSEMEPKEQGLDGIYGGTTSKFGQTAQEKKEATLEKITIISAIVFVVSALAVAAL